VRAQAAAGDGERRRSAASGGALAGETQSKVPRHELARGSHLCAAGEATDLSRAARPVETRQRRRMTRRGGGATPASARSTKGSGSKASDTSVLLTSKRGSGSASRRQRDNGGKERRCQRGLGFRRRRG
jgi:hypothetical protein